MTTEVKPFEFRGTVEGHIVVAGQTEVAEITEKGINFNKYKLDDFHFSTLDLQELIDQYNKNYKIKSTGGNKMPYVKRLPLRDD